MKCLILFAVVIAGVACFPPYDGPNQNTEFEIYKVAFEKFKRDFHKNYDQKDEDHRLGIFSQNYATILKHNEAYEKGATDYKMDVTRFSDLTRDEFIKFLEEEAGGKTLPPWW